MTTEIIEREGFKFKIEFPSPDDAGAGILYEDVEGRWVECAQGPVKFLKNVHIPAEIKAHRRR